MAYKHEFADIKGRFRIEKVAEMLGVKLAPDANGFRGQCPCGRGNHRSLSISTARQTFYCFGTKKDYGDCIQLAAHAKGIDVKEAAEWLDGTVPSKRDDTRNNVRPKGDSTLAPLDYLEHDHPAVIALGFEPEEAQALGIGWAGRGTMGGHVLVPMRLEDGTLAGYIGLDDIATLPKKWRIPNANVVALPKRA